MNIITITTPSAEFNKELSDSKAIYYSVKNDLDSAKDFFLNKQAIGLRNLDYYAARQWTAEEIRAHEKQFRKAYVFNEIQRIVESLIGTQTQTRLDTKVMPREVGDEKQAELLNYIVKWVEQINDIEYVETEVFTDGLIRGRGAAVIRWSTENLAYGYPKIEKIPVDELYWDINTKDLGLKDARWAARVMEMTKQDALEMMPWAKETIMKASSLGTTSRVDYLIDDYKDHFKNDYTNDGRRDNLLVVEHYEKIKAAKYLVMDDISGKQESFDSQIDAEEYYNGLVEAYSDQGVPIVSSNGADLVAYIETTVNQLIQTVLVGDEVVSHEPVALQDFPWLVFFCYHDNGDFWAMVDNFISPQDLLNRSFSQLDYQLGSAAKNVMTVIENRLGQSMKIEDVRREISKTSSVIPVKFHDAISAFPNQPVNPELFNNINFAIQRINDYGGGRNALGLQESAAESGRAVIARAEQAGVGRLPLFDRLRYWRKQLALQMIWYIKNFMSPNQVFRIIGYGGEVQWVELDDQTLDTLKEIQYDIIIDEATKSESVLERNFQQIKDALAVMPGLPPEVAMSVMLKFMPLPQTSKQEIQNLLEFYKSYMTEQAEAQKQQRLMESAQDAIMKKSMKEQLETAQIIAQQEQGLPGNQKSVKTQLDKLDGIKNQLAEKGGGMNMQQMDSLRSPEELRNAQANSIAGKLQATNL